MFDFNFGLGPLLKVFAFLYITYLTVFAKLKVPALYFYLFGIGSLLYSNHLYNLSMLKNAFFKVVNKPSLLMMPAFLEHSSVGILAILVGIYVSMQK